MMSKGIESDGYQTHPVLDMSKSNLASLDPDVNKMSERNWQTVRNPKKYRSCYTGPVFDINISNGFNLFSEEDQELQTDQLGNIKTRTSNLGR